MPVSSQLPALKPEPQKLPFERWGWGVDLELSQGCPWEAVMGQEPPFLNERGILWVTPFKHPENFFKIL